MVVKCIATVDRVQFSAFCRNVYLSTSERHGRAVNQSPDRDINLSNDRSCATSRGQSNSVRSIFKFEKKARTSKERGIGATFSLGYVNSSSFFVFLFYLLRNLANLPRPRAWQIFDVRKFGLNAFEIASYRVNLLIRSLDASKLWIF